MRGERGRGDARVGGAVVRGSSVLPAVEDGSEGSADGAPCMM